MKLSDELQLAVRAARSAGEFLKKREGIRVDALIGRDIKLSSDKMSEKIIMDILDESGIPILSEEYGFKGEEGKEFWVVDPLDGTVNYFKGMDELSCVSIALLRGGHPVLGAVYRFVQDELFYGEEDFGAYCNDIQIKPSDTEDVSQAVMATGFPVKRSYDSESLASFIKQVQRFKKVRMLGSAATMGTFVACGKLDAYFEENIMIWDVAAAAAIVGAAGGAVDLKLLEDSKTICRCFANRKLMEDYYAESL